MSYELHSFEDGKVLDAEPLNEMDIQIQKVSRLKGVEPEWSFTTDYQTELDRIVTAVTEHQDDSKMLHSAFIAFTDIHKNTLEAHPEFARMMQAINYFTHKLNIDFVVSLGDNIDTPVEGSNYDVYYELRDALEELNAPYVNIMGNHDWVAAVYKRNWATNIREAVFDKVGAWFYFDDNKYDVRYIVLDCQDRGNDANAWTLVTTKASGVTDRSWQQLDWLANVALKTNKKVVFLGHQSLGVKQGNVIASTSNTDNYFIAKTIVQAFEAGTAGSANYTVYYSAETTAQDTVDWDFTEQGEGTVLFNVHGHTHGDIFTNPNYTTASAVSSVFNEIVLDDAICNTATYIGTANTKTLGTVNEVAFDIICIDHLNSIVRCYRFGTGADRVCNLDGELE